MIAFLALFPAVAIAGAHQSSANLAWAPSAPNSYYYPNRKPLLPSPFAKLPLGAIAPTGWLKTQLKLEANGFSGRLAELSEFLQPADNAWLSPTGEGTHGWEEVPYWLRGFVDLAGELKDPKLLKEARKWIEPLIASQTEDCWFGPKSNLTANNGTPDVWPNMLALQALQSWYEYSKDSRVLPLMKRYFRWEALQPDNKIFQGYWDDQRTADNMLSVLWLYNHTGDPELLPLVDKLHSHSPNWMAGVPNWHGVNIAQAFREPAEYGVATDSLADVQDTDTDYHIVKSEYGQFPGGMYAADENARPGAHDPRQATELCAMAEMMMSDEYLFTATGDARWADRCEDVAFNSFPASMTSDLKGLRYLTAVNMPQADSKNHSPGIQNGGAMMSYNPHDYRCCQHNGAMGWPKFAESTWVATSGNGLAAALYAPTVVRAKVGTGVVATLRETTTYPFGDAVEISMDLAKPTQFPLTFRIPTWAVNPTIKVNGKLFATTAGSGYSRPWTTVIRKWRSGDKVELVFPSKVVVHHYAQNGGAVSVSKGPLSYSLKIGEKKKRDGGTDAWPAYSYFPTTPWNYGLDLSKSIQVVKRGPDPNRVQPWEMDNVPIELVAEGREIPEWKLDRFGLAAVLQQSPAYAPGPDTKLTLIPMGAARLRIAEFPVVSNSPSATHWTAPGRPRPSISAKASTCWPSDTVDALTDGLEPSSSDDETVPRFTWWDHKGTAEWVELDFPKLRTLTGVGVYWFDDEPSGGMCRPPASWYVQYWNGTDWVGIDTNAPGLAINKFNWVAFPKVETAKLRVAAQLRPGFSSGILQVALK